jgi:hypothetical protein
MSISRTWGTTLQERQLSYPCDHLIGKPDDSLYRAVTIDANAQVVFRWLCQMRVAPYSYDWIDNCGRESPRTLTPGLEDLVVGQDVMQIFQLVDFARNQNLTIRCKANSRAQRLFGDIAISYCVVGARDSTSRLLVKIVAQYPKGLWGQAIRSLLPWGDLIMMRRQLLNFKQLAEASKLG